MNEAPDTIETPTDKGQTVAPHAFFRLTEAPNDWKSRLLILAGIFITIALYQYQTLFPPVVFTLAALTGWGILIRYVILTELNVQAGPDGLLFDCQTNSRRHPLHGKLIPWDQLKVFQLKSPAHAGPVSNSLRLNFEGERLYYFTGPHQIRFYDYLNTFFPEKAWKLSAYLSGTWNSRY